MGGLRTEFSFTLPKGYVDSAGTLHRRGTMRLATARDEIEPLRDARINDAEDPFLTILVLARVITELGTLAEVTPAVVEGLFAADLAFLQDVYGIINFGDRRDLVELQAAVLADDNDDEDGYDDYDADELMLADDDDTIDADADADDSIVIDNNSDNAFLAQPSTALRRRAIEEVHAANR